MISIVAIPITFIAGRRSRKQPEVRYATDFDALLGPSDSLFGQGLHMTLGEQKIDRISRTRIALWNNHGDTINKNDIVPADPLRIKFEEKDCVLRSRILSVSRDQIELMAEPGPARNSVLVEFEFLDDGDGGIVEVVHQGSILPTLEGTIRGAKIISNGLVELKPEVLAAVAGKPLQRRLQKFLARNSGIIILVTINIAIICFTSFKAFLPLVGSPGRLIDPQHYNLSTIRGQINFTNAVQNTNYYNQSSETAFIVIMAALLTAVVIFLARASYKGAKKMIPPEIALHRKWDGDGGSQQVKDSKP